MALSLRLRYLMVDPPELSSDDCYSLEAKEFNSQLVFGREVTLRYDTECEDRFGRTLAYVYVGDTEINRLMVERGCACQLHLSPNATIAWMSSSALRPRRAMKAVACGANARSWPATDYEYYTSNLNVANDRAIRG